MGEKVLNDDEYIWIIGVKYIRVLRVKNKSPLRESSEGVKKSYSNTFFSLSPIEWMSGRLEIVST